MKQYRFCSYHKYHRIDEIIAKLLNNRIYMRSWGRMGEHYRLHLDHDSNFKLLVATVAFTHDGHIIGACISDFDYFTEDEVDVMYNTYVRKPYRRQGIGSHLSRLCYKNSCRFYPNTGKNRHVADMTDYISDTFWERNNIQIA